MHYLKLTIQRNRRRIQLEQLLLLLLRISLPVLLFFYLARPILNPTGLEQWLGTGGRSSQVVLIDDSMSMGYSAGEAPAFQRALQAAAGLLASIRPQDHCTVVTTLVARVPGDPRRRGLAPRRDLGRRGVAASHRHSCRLARSARGSRRGLALVHLSHAPAHHLDRPAQERVGRGVSAISRRWSERRRPGADRRCRQRRGHQRFAPGACAGRSHDPGRSAQRLGGRDQERLTAHAHRRQGDPARRRPADRGGRCRRSRLIRRCACRSRSRSPDRGRTKSPSSFRTTSCPATTSAGLPCRSRIRF